MWQNFKIDEPLASGKVGTEKKQESRIMTEIEMTFADSRAGALGGEGGGIQPVLTDTAWHVRSCSHVLFLAALIEPDLTSAECRSVTLTLRTLRHCSYKSSQCQLKSSSL